MLVLSSGINNTKDIHQDHSDHNHVSEAAQVWYSHWIPETTVLNTKVTSMHIFHRSVLYLNVFERNNFQIFGSRKITLKLEVLVSHLFF